MLPFAIVIVSGESPYRQVVFAATKAIVSGDMPAGAPFPSVREISQALKINPNTAHKVVAELVRDGLLEVLPGIGTIVARGHKATAAQKRALLSRDVDALLVEAKRIGLGHDEVQKAIGVRWRALFGSPGIEPMQSEPGNDH